MSSDAADVASICASVFTGASLLVASWAFLRDAGIRQFELCTRLSEGIEALWLQLNSEEDSEKYKHKLIAILNHYERCCCYLNSVKFLSGRSTRILKKQIVEAVERNWADRYFQEVFRGACSGETTFFELREVLGKSKIISTL